jgi:hypothetical protein
MDRQPVFSVRSIFIDGRMVSSVNSHITCRKAFYQVVLTGKGFFGLAPMQKDW